jgi:uncharacterized protein YjbI with pentapeptide repeats
MDRPHRDHPASPNEGPTDKSRGYQFDVDVDSLASRALDSIARSAATYRLATRVVLAGVFSCLIATVVLVPELRIASSRVAVILTSGALAILGVFVSTFVLDRWRGVSRERELSLPGLSPSEIAKYTRDLSSEDEGCRLGALYFLTAVTGMSNANAGLIVHAVESFLQRALRPDKSTDDLIVDRRRADVQSALELIGRLPARTRRGSGGLIRYRIDNLDLRDYNLGGLDFSAADLRGSNLSGCVLEYTNFDGADLRYAILQDVTAVRASFRGALLERADCSGGFFVEADFSKALLAFAKFDGAVLVRANLTDSILLYSGIGDADLRDVELTHSGSATTDINDVLSNQQLQSSRAAAIALEDGHNKRPHAS